MSDLWIPKETMDALREWNKHAFQGQQVYPAPTRLLKFLDTLRVVPQGDAEAALDRLLRDIAAMPYSARTMDDPRIADDNHTIRRALRERPDESSDRSAAQKIRKDFFEEIQRLLLELAYPDDWDDEVVRVKDAVVHIQGYLDRLEGKNLGEEHP